MKPKLQFNITHKDKSCYARAGFITTKHGTVRTPGFVPVGTAATVKTLTPEDIKACGIDVFFVNTYHMMFRPGIAIVKKMGGLHAFMNWPGNIMTDSGGFQAFSLGEHGPRQGVTDTSPLAKIEESGIRFKSAWDGREVFLGPIESISAQSKLASDIMMAFDECTFYPITEAYARKAMERTHRWLNTCITSQKQNGPALYGIVQGAVYEDLRIESARFVCGKNVDGFAIGSAANGKEPRSLVFKVLDWTVPILHEVSKPIHFLGIGEVEDIFESVARGVDTLDCVTPTRMARMGYVFSRSGGHKNKFRYDITKKEFEMDKKPLEKDCACYTCRNFSRSYIRHLFRNRELLSYRLLTIHNLTFFGRLMEKIRDSIANGSFMRLKRSWVG